MNAPITSGTDTTGSASDALAPAGSQDPVDLVFIAGVSFCGSTLLAIVLDTHPDVFSIGEMGPTPRSEKPGYLCSCGTELAKCPFYLRVKQRMVTEGVSFNTARMDLRYFHSPSPLWNRLWTGGSGIAALDHLRDNLRDRLPRFRNRKANYHRRTAAFIRASLAESGKRVFLDGTKRPQRIAFLREMEPAIRTRVVHLVRDPRGYCYSAKRHQGKSAAQAANEWVDNNISIEIHLAPVEPDRVLRMRYEDFCANPDSAVQALTDFMGISRFVIPDDFRSAEHHIIGNQMRGGDDQRRAIRLDEKWRGALDDRATSTVSRIAGKTARQYGYDI